MLSNPEPDSFIARTASTGSSRTSVEFAHVRGSSSVDEKTTFGVAVSSSTDPASSDVNSSVPGGMSPAAKPDMSR